MKPKFLTLVILVSKNKSPPPPPFALEGLVLLIDYRAPRLSRVKSTFSPSLELFVDVYLWLVFAKFLQKNYL
jgi:hypothetical protein